MTEATDRKPQVLFIGIDGEQAVTSKRTQEQIARIESLKCALQTENGKTLTWLDLNDPAKPKTMFQSILADRTMEIDQRRCMVDRLAFCVAIVESEEVVRLEYYEGDEECVLLHDLRSKELRGKILANYLTYLILRREQNEQTDYSH